MDMGEPHHLPESRRIPLAETTTHANYLPEAEVIGICPTEEFHEAHRAVPHMVLLDES